MRTKNRDVEHATQLERAKSRSVRSEAQRSLFRVVGLLGEIIECRMEISVRNLNDGGRGRYHSSSFCTPVDFVCDVQLAVKRALPDKREQDECWKWFQTKTIALNGKEYRADAQRWIRVGIELQRRELHDLKSYFRPSDHQPHRQRGATTKSIRARYECLRTKDAEWRRLRDEALAVANGKHGTSTHYTSRGASSGNRSKLGETKARV